MQTGTENTDWNGLRMGDKQAFMRLYEAHYQALFSFGCRTLADRELVKDKIHELFCELWDRHPHLPEVEQPRSYLFTILKRKLLKEAEKLSMHTELGQVHAYERSYEELLLESQTDESTRKQVRALLEKLTPGQLQLIQLKYYEQLSYEEIATRLNLQPRTVYNQVSLALKTLRSQLKLVLNLFVFFFFS